MEFFGDFIFYVNDHPPIKYIIFRTVGPKIMRPQARQFWGEDLIRAVFDICTRFYIVSTEFSGLWDRDEKYMA